jgi:hypothetical protein
MMLSHQSRLSTYKFTNMHMVVAVRRGRGERMCARSQLRDPQALKITPRLRSSLHNEEPHIQAHGRKQHDHDGIAYRNRQGRS